MKKEIYMEGYHFWFSHKQLQVCKQCNLALINSKEVQYTSCSQTLDHGCVWDDMIYLGQGSYSRSCKL